MSTTKTIRIYSRDDDSLAAVIEYKNQSLCYTAYTPELEHFLKTNIPLWQKRKYSYPYQNTYVQTDCTRSDFLDGLYHYLFQKVRRRIFSMKYYFV